MNRRGIFDTLQQPASILASSAVQKMRKTLDELLRRRRAFRNREGHSSFNFTLFKHNRRAGTSAVIRARNEAKKIVYCLSSILDIFDEIVFVDNSSDDTTLSLVHHIKDEHDKHNKIKIYSYPFRLARFGPEHDKTPEDSVHSFVYYTNWALSHCSFRYVCKWDGDMVLRKAIRGRFREFLYQIQADEKKLWTLSGQTVYRDLAGGYYLSIGEINREVEVFPYGFHQRFYKSKHWECLGNKSHLPVDHFGPVAFWELKFADEDEFSHWSTTDWPSQRKKREWANFLLIRESHITPDRFQELSADFLEKEVAEITYTKNSQDLCGTPPRLERSMSKPPTDWVLVFAKAFLTPGIRRWIRQQRRPRRFQRLLRPTDVFLIGHPKSGNTWLAYMLAVVLAKDQRDQVTLSNVGNFVPIIHGEDLRLGEFCQLSDPRILRNERPIYPELYPKVIYLVRDPRSVLVSFYHFYRITVNDHDMTLPSFIDQYLTTNGIFKEWYYRGLERWDRQVLSWTQRAKQDKNIHVVRYEELVADRQKVLEEVLRFSGVPYAEEDLALAVTRGSFAAMRKNEEEFGAESYPDEIGRRGRFIRRGKTDGWKEELTEDLARKIEGVFDPAMRAVGYLT